MTIFYYLIVGSLAYLIDLGCFILILSTQNFFMGPVFASLVSKITSSLFSFFAHRSVTFKHQKDTPCIQQSFKYFLLVILNAPFSAWLLMINLHWISIPLHAKIVTDILCMALSYWLSKQFVFVTRR
jgi:putative flippase GtrA